MQKKKKKDAAVTAFLQEPEAELRLLMSSSGDTYFTASLMLAGNGSSV